MDAITDGILVDGGVARCWWPGDHADYRDYHDHEWGLPVADDRRLFEKLCLEGFQSGLSWLTILRKRARMREVFHGFDLDAVAAMGEADIDRLVGDPGIIRHRGKIASVLNNARRAREIVDAYGTLAAFVWGFEPPASERPKTFTRGTLQAMAQTPSSQALSKALRRRGWTFVGPTTCYAFMQAMGLVNDHLDGCAARPLVEAARHRFVRPAAEPTAQTSPRSL
ncbi:MAG: DNA-3-methyladenine glycosylase I [Nannocystaceae bacterium]